MWPCRAVLCCLGTVHVRRLPGCFPAPVPPRCWLVPRRTAGGPRSHAESPPPECCPGAVFVTLSLGSGTIKGIAVRAEKPHDEACSHVHTRAYTHMTFPHGMTGQLQGTTHRRVLALQSPSHQTFRKDPMCLSRIRGKGFAGGRNDRSSWLAVDFFCLHQPPGDSGSPRQHPAFN